MSPTAIDLFAGAGGATQGLKQAGSSVLASVELDSIAAQTYRLNHPTVQLWEQDIRSLSPTAVLNRLGFAVSELDLLNACPPCQGWSTLGNGDESDPRNDLVTEVWRFIDQLRPKSWLIENVTGLERDQRMAALVEKARHIDYAVRSYRVNASDFGVPQNRKRLIVIGILGGIPSSFPSSLEACVPSDFAIPFKTAGEAISAAGALQGSADPVHRARKSNPTVSARIQAVPQGGSRFDLPIEHQLECHKRLKTKKSAAAAYGRINATGLAPAMTSRCTTPACGRFIHPTEHRGLSLREAALIQSFPLEYMFHGSYQSIESQIGNAFPPKMAEALSRIVLAMIRTDEETR